MEVRKVQPWLRKIIITMGPLGDGKLKQFVSDGTLNSLRVVCSINKTLMGAPSPSIFDIYNLAENTRASLNKGLVKISCEAGWENTEVHKIFDGNVLSAISERKQQGTDIITRIQALPGYEALMKSNISKTFAAGTSVATVVTDLGSKLQNVNMDEESVIGVEGVISASGWSYAGSTKNALTKLADEYGFSWHIENGNFRAVGDKFNFSGKVELNGDNGGLIEIVPSLTGPDQVQTGVRIKALYVPGVQPGHLVSVKSQISKGLNGDYKVHTININLDAFSDSWSMDIDSINLDSLGTKQNV